MWTAADLVSDLGNCEPESFKNSGYYLGEDPDNPDCAPADANGFKYYHIEGTVKFSDSTQQPILINMIPPKISSGVYGFEPGKIYNIIINIKKN